MKGTNLQNHSNGHSCHSQNQINSQHVNDTEYNTNTTKDIKIFTKALMRQKIIQTLENKSLNDKDLSWIRSLCEEFKERVQQLTPSRLDLKEAWNTSFDIELLLQMFQHDAVESSDANHIVEIVFDRLIMLCAPVQDEAIKEAKQKILTIKDTPRKLAVLLEISHDILSDIEDLLRKFHAQQN